MRVVVLSALVAGATASLEKSPVEARSFGHGYDHGHHGYPHCGGLHGCNKQHHGEFFPDQNSFHFPGEQQQEARHWDLCRDNRHCSPDEAYGHVDFDFQQDDLVFDFQQHEKREELVFEEVEIFLSRGEQKFDESHRFGSHRGNCHNGYHDHTRCHIPFNEIVDGGRHGICPHRYHESFIFFVKIRTVVKTHEERYELFNRAQHRRQSYNSHGYDRQVRRDYAYANNYGHQEDDSISLGYSCTECKKEEYQKECKYHEDHAHNEHSYQNGILEKPDYPQSEDYLPEKHHGHFDHDGSYGHHGYDDGSWFPSKYENHGSNEQHGSHGHRGYGGVSWYPGKNEPHGNYPHHGSHGHHGYDDGSWYPNKYEHRYHQPENHHHKPQHHRQQPEYHHCGHCPNKACFKKPQHPHYARSYRSDDDFECSGAFIKAFGHGQNGCHLKELEREGYHGCGRDDGIFHRYPRSDLEVSVHGPITHGSEQFGFFGVKIEKRADHISIVIRIKVDDIRYIIAEAAAFVECDGGHRDYDTAGDGHPSICRPESYPLRHHNALHYDEFELEAIEKQRCEGEYFIAIWVLVCVKDGQDDCHWQKHHRSPHSGPSLSIS